MCRYRNSSQWQIKKLKKKNSYWKMACKDNVVSMVDTEQMASVVRNRLEKVSLKMNEKKIPKTRFKNKKERKKEEEKKKVK